MRASLSDAVTSSKSPRFSGLCVGNLLFRSVSENTAQVQDRDPFHIFGTSSTRGQGVRRYDPSHALPVIERGPGVLLKSSYLRRSLMLTGRKLALTLAFTALVALAFGAGCRGFFPKNSLSSIAIQPPSPQVQVGQSTGLQAWGTYQDNNKSQLTSGVVWTTSNNQTVSINPNTGEITGEGSGGTATITAAAQGISATAQATAFLGNVTGLTVCTGTFNTGTCPASTWTISGTVGGTQNYYAKATSNGTIVDVTTVATWTVM